jgi:sugar-specific transcriptional regulator TrmB
MRLSWMSLAGLCVKVENLISNRNMKLKNENEALEKKIKDLEFELLVKILTEQGEIVDHIKDMVSKSYEENNHKVF